MSGCEARKKSYSLRVCLNSDRTWPYHVMSQESAKMVPTSALKKEPLTLKNILLFFPVLPHCNISFYSYCDPVYTQIYFHILLLMQYSSDHELLLAFSTFPFPSSWYKLISISSGQTIFCFRAVFWESDDLYSRCVELLFPNIL